MLRLAQQQQVVVVISEQAEEISTAEFARCDSTIFERDVSG